MALKGSLAKAKGEVAIFRGLFTEATEKASLSEHRASEATAKAMEAFKKGEEFRQELLESYQDAYTKGT